MHVPPPGTLHTCFVLRIITSETWYS